MNNPITCTRKSILENVGKNTFKWLNETLGFNFEKPIILNCFTGNFTIKQVWNIIPHNNYDYTVCVLVSNKGMYSGIYHAVELFRDNFNIELKSRTYFNDYHTYPDTFYRKSEFDKYRKSETAKTFIIAQRKEYTNERKIPDKYSTYGNYPLNNNDRYIVRKYWKCTNTHHTKTWINRVDITETISKGLKYTVNVPNCENESDLFDKSGYYVFNRKEELKRKAKEIKANREKEKYNNTDYSVQVSNIQSLFIEKKKAVVSALLKVSNHDQMVIVDKMVSGLRWTTFDIDLFIKRTTNREYSSNEKAIAAYNNIIARLNDITD